MSQPFLEGSDAEPGAEAVALPPGFASSSLSRKGFAEKLRAEVEGGGSEYSTVASTPPGTGLAEQVSDAGLGSEEGTLAPWSSAEEEGRCEGLPDAPSPVPEEPKPREVTPPKVAADLAPDSKNQKKKGGSVLFNCTLTDYEVVPKAAEARGWKLVKAEEKAAQCNVHWIDFAVVGEWLPRIEPWMRVNHFPGMNSALARKTRLARNMARMQRHFPKEYQFIPPTWVLPDDLCHLEKRFSSAPDAQQTKCIYIVKPDHQCQGRGIFLTSDLERIRKCSAESREKDQLAVVQRYIMRPMLIDGLKFDLRLYFLVCAVQSESSGLLEPRCFLFRDGLVRLCTTAYEPPTADTLEDRRMHLTNYAVNKHSKHFQQPDADDGGSGSKRSLRWFLRYVEEQFGEKEREKLWTKLMGLCVKMLLTVQPTLDAEYHSTFPKDLTGGQMGCRCFEILGVDAMLDAKRKPYLIEVNHLPSFTCDSSLDEDIKRRLIDQTMDITCGRLSAKDKKTYEAMMRERREGISSGSGNPAQGAATAVKAPVASEAEGTPSGPWLLDVEEYKDFERAYPVPRKAPKLAAQCEAILSHVREVFRPVQVAARRRTTDPDASQAPAASSAAAAGKAAPKPPLPPASSTSGAPVKPPPGQPSSPVMAAPSASAAGLTQEPRPQLHLSDPGPAAAKRRALPRLATRSASPRARRGRSAKKEGQPESTTTAASCPMRPSRSMPPPRECLQLKSAQISLGGF